MVTGRNRRSHTGRPRPGIDKSSTRSGQTRACGEWLDAGVGRHGTALEGCCIIDITPTEASKRLLPLAISPSMVLLWCSLLWPRARCAVMGHTRLHRCDLSCAERPGSEAWTWLVVQLQPCFLVEISVSLPSCDWSSETRMAKQQLHHRLLMSTMFRYQCNGEPFWNGRAHCVDGNERSSLDLVHESCSCMRMQCTRWQVDRFSG